MKIIFNHTIHDWYWQIFDELKRNHEIILPSNFEEKNQESKPIDLDALERVVDKNRDANFIFDFKGDLLDLIIWNKKNKNIPLIILVTNVIGRTHKAKLSIFSNVWYVNANATQFIKRYNVNNLIFEGMAANPYIFYPKKMKKEYDITFFGQFYGDRSYYLQEIKKFCLKSKTNYYTPLGHGEKMPWSFDEINKLYNQSKINLSFAQMDFLGRKIKRRVNLRTFEICMSGNFQLLQYTPCVEEYFEVDEEIVCWKNKKDLFNKILYYLENEDEREKIAKNGFKRAIENHTWSKRFEKINNILNEKQSKFDITKYTVNNNKFLDKYEFNRVEKSLLNNTSKKALRLILKKYGYKLNRDVKNKKVIKIKLKENKINYKPNLKDFIFINLKGKMIMVIKVISHNSKLNLRDWGHLEKILYLTENFDLSLPQYGLLTNGFEWVIRDFSKRRWLNRIPNRVDLINKFKLRYKIKRIQFYIKKMYKEYNFKKLFIIKNLEKHFRFFFIKVVKKFRYKLRV